MAQLPIYELHLDELHLAQPAQTILVEAQLLVENQKDIYDIVKGILTNFDGMNFA